MQLMAFVFRPTSFFFVWRLLWWCVCRLQSRVALRGFSGICSNLSHVHESLSWSQKPISAVQNLSEDRLKSQDFVCIKRKANKTAQRLLKASALGLNEGITWLPEHLTLQCFYIFYIFIFHVDCKSSIEFPKIWTLF